MKRKTTRSTATISFAQSSYTLRDFSILKKNILSFLSRFKKAASDSSENMFASNGNRKQKNFKKIIPVALLIIVMGGVIILAGRLVAASSAPTKNQDDRAVVKEAKATQTINKEIAIPVLDSKGKTLTTVKYTIETAELRDEIIVKGSRATAIQGRTFLILTIKLVNAYDKSIDINARDYVRLSVNGSEQELLAADIHNDPVNIQPISTKTTRVGFPINDTDTQLVLKVGEIKSNKESIPLNF